MGRDKVLGLSLAILLIGFGGAFCFRNEPFVENGLKLARAKILDEGIAKRLGPKPYVADSKHDASPTPESKPTVTLGGIESVELPQPKFAQRLHGPGLNGSHSAPASVRKPRLDQDVPTNPLDRPDSPPATDRFVAVQTERPRRSVVPTTVTPVEPPARPKERAAERTAPDGVKEKLAKEDRVPNDRLPNDRVPVERVQEDRPPEDHKREDRKPEHTASVDRPIELTIRPATPAFDPPDSLLDDAATWQHRPNERDGCPAMAGTEHRELESTRPPRAAKRTAAPTTTHTASTTKSGTATNGATTNGDATSNTATTTYIVRRGDTLSRIALHFLGDANRYREIYNVNRDQLPTLNARLKIGMTLRIPCDHNRPRRSAASTAAKTKTSHPSPPTNTAPKTRQVPAQPVSRTRETPRIQPLTPDRTPPPTKDDDHVQQPTGDIRFLPVQRGPFWRSRGDSTGSEGSRDLSQRPPTAKEQSRRQRDVHAEGDTANSSSTKTDTHESDADSMGSSGSEGT